MGPAIRDKERGTRLLMFLGVIAVYLLFPTKSYFFDGVAFAQIIEDYPALHPSLFHPNHLIYNVVGSLFYHLLLGVGLKIRAIAALQILNSILSGASAFVLFLILRTVLKSRYLTYSLTLLFAFSATWWKFSTDADAYIPSVLFLLLSVYLALPNRKATPLFVGLTYAVALCFHQIAIVAFPMLVVACFMQGGSLVRSKRVVNALVFSATAGIATLFAYTYSFYRLTRTVQLKNLVRWMISYAPDESFGFHAWNNLVFTVRGHLRLFFGGRLNAAKGLMGPFLILLLVLLGALLVVFLYRVVRTFKKPGLGWVSMLRHDLLTDHPSDEGTATGNALPRRGTDLITSQLGGAQRSTRRQMTMLCLLWVGVYLVFLFFLLAHHTFYRLFYLPALIILIGLCCDAYESVTSHSRQYRLAMFVAIVFLLNFVTSIYPFSHEGKYPPLVLALEMNQVWPKGTVVYYALPNSDESLVRYFNPGMVWK